MWDVLHSSTDSFVVLRKYDMLDYRGGWKQEIVPNVTRKKIKFESNTITSLPAYFTYCMHIDYSLGLKQGAAKLQARPQPSTAMFLP